MKKLIVTVVVILTVLTCFAACKKDDSQQSTTDKVVDISSVTDSSETTKAQKIDFETTRPKEESSTIEAKKTMKISVPYYLIENEADGNVSGFASTYGYEISKEKDGYATMKMDGIEYSLLLSNVGMSVIKSIGELIDSGDYPYIIRLADYSEDFSYLLFEIDTDKYKKYGKKTPYTEAADLIGMTGMYYQYFTVEEDNKCEVVFASSKTGKVVYTNTYTD